MKNSFPHASIIWGSLCAKNESTALYNTFVFVYIHGLLVQVNQYMLACMLSVDIVLICCPTLLYLCHFYCGPYCGFVLSSCCVVLTVVLFCRSNSLSSNSVVQKNKYCN